ncbi:rod-binding protein [Humidesulfovibrio sp.]
MADIAAQDAVIAAKKAQDGEIVALKQQMDRLKGDLSANPAVKQKLRKACTDFEAVFISKIWEQMRATIPKGGMLQSPQEDMYRSMFDREFTEKMAQDGGIGLGDMLYNQLKEKVQGGGKMTRPGALSLESGLKGAPVEQHATNGALPEKPNYALPEKPSHVLPGRRARVSASAAPLTAAAATAPASAARNASSAYAAASATAASATPKPPASVPGAVMADVEALAQRIEADYDRKQAAAAALAAAQGQVSRYGQPSAANPLGTGSRIAVTG